MAAPQPQVVADADAAVDSDASRAAWRVRVLLAAGFTAIALIATARAKSDHHHRHATKASDVRSFIADQLTAESESIGRAFAIVKSKLADADAVRAHRAAAAYRLLRDERSGTSAIDNARSGDGRMAAARRHAAVWLLLARDRHERELLADELDQLGDAAARVARNQTAAKRVIDPPRLAPPVRGTIARHFGTLVHGRSHATLSRRGLDFEVARHSDVSAPADGVVRYAGPIRGLVNGVILEHGSYLTVIAKLGELAVSTGAHVARGDQIGRASRHRVYLELRAEVGPGGLPIDPEPLLAPDLAR